MLPFVLQKPSLCFCCPETVKPEEAMKEQNWKRPSPRVAGLPSGSRLPHAGPVYSSILGCSWHHSVGPPPRTSSQLLSGNNAIASVLQDNKYSARYC
uniref:Uncharacterized protein n=1 Tax=Felis catus TaxID=9685 RepID=A0ABI8ABF6_FELCA